jgi:3-deoxy-7-phosphoheptulonate synthase
MNMNFYRKLPIPKEVKEQFPISSQLAKRREDCVTELKRIFAGESDRLILVIGP